MTRLLRHERTILATCLVLLAALCWWFLIRGAGMPHDSMAAMAPPPLPALVLMWWLMMLAMMLPSAVPAIQLYAQVRRQRGRSEVVQPWIFAFGYGLVWLTFAVLAALIQRIVAGPDMALASSGAASAVLIAAGIYQLSPFKGACLRQCRSPAMFLSHHWRRGATGAIRLGVVHGAYCVGCCWMLMALLFVGGIMNLLWIAALTAVVAAEKLVPRGEWIARGTGVALIAWGAVRLLG
jgi:predicted metal-binding membrane protein